MIGATKTWVALSLAAALAVAATLPFSQALRHPFLAYDDDRFVTRNPAVRAGLTTAGVAWAFTTMHAANWQPLAWISHMTDVELFDLDPAGHHGTNLALHGLNAALLFLLLLRLTGAAGRSFVAAALFAVHPLRVESVMWVAQRNNLLGATFGLLSLLAYCRYVARPSPGRYAAVLAWFVCGLLAKPVVLTLPLVLLLLDYWPLDRSRTPAPTSTPSPTHPSPRWRLLFEKLPLLALSCISAIVTYLAQSRGLAVAALDTVPLEWRISNALVAYLRYLVNIFRPVDLVALYPYPAGRLSLGATVVALLLLLAIGAGAWRLRRRLPAVLVGWLWFLGMFVPMIGIVQAGSQSMADRYTYWPAIGIAVAAVWLTATAADALRVSGGLRAACAGLVLLAFGVESARLAAAWESDLTLFGRAAALAGGNFIAEVNYGAALARAGRTEEALARYRRAIAFNPRYADAHFNLGVNLDRLGREAEARAAYLEALRCDPGHAAARTNLGLLLARAGRNEEAVASFREALRSNPDLTQAHLNLGLALLRLERREEAAGQFREVLRIQPDNQAARSELRRLEAVRTRR